MSDRIKYVEGSSLPHFEGDKATMTATEAMMIVRGRDMRPVADEMFRCIEAFMRDKLMFSGDVGGVLPDLARKIMGDMHPIDDNDPEYYEFQQRVFDMIRRQMETAILNVAREL